MIVTLWFLAALGTVGFVSAFRRPEKVLSLLRPLSGSRLAGCTVSGAGAECRGSHLFASVLVIFPSRMGLWREKRPVTIFLISGIIPLVPEPVFTGPRLYMVTDQLDRSWGDSALAALKAAAEAKH